MKETKIPTAPTRGAVDSLWKNAVSKLRYRFHGNDIHHGNQWEVRSQGSNRKGEEKIKQKDRLEGKSLLKKRKEQKHADKMVDNTGIITLHNLPASPGGARRLIGSRYLSHVSRFGNRWYGSRPAYCHPLTIDLICHDETRVRSKVYQQNTKEEIESLEDLHEDDYLLWSGFSPDELDSLRRLTSSKCSIDNFQ